METKPVTLMNIEEKVIYLRQNYPTRIPVKVVAQMLDATELYVRCGLSEGKLSFGSAVLGNGGRWSFNIPTDRFIMYLAGEDIVKATQENLLDNLKEAFDAWLTKTKTGINQAV